MKHYYYTLQNIREAIKNARLASIDTWETKDTATSFMKALAETKPGERENIVIATLGPE